MNREFEAELFDITNLEERAYKLVQHLFSGRTDKAGYPYITHLERVRDKFQDSFFRTIALLHDVVEDTPITFSDLERFGFDGSYIDILSLLTRDKKMSYHEYISRIIHSKNKIALLVKLADMEDNMSDVRLKELDEVVRNHLLKKYSSQMIRLKEAKGEMELC